MLARGPAPYCTLSARSPAAIGRLFGTRHRAPNRWLRIVNVIGYDNFGHQILHRVQLRNVDHLLRCVRVVGRLSSTDFAFASRGRGSRL